MNVEYLDEFIFLADTLSFKQTADHFYVSRSVISRHIAALEEMLGVRLINRANHAVGLTEAGQVFYRDAKAILRDWNAAIERVRGVGGEGSCLVRIGYLRNASRPVLVKFMRHMAEEHPNVRVSLTCMEYAELRRAMEDRVVDVALAMNVNPGISRNYRSTRIYEDDFYVVCACDHPLALRKHPLTLGDLRGQKVVLPDSFKDVGLADIVEGLKSEGVPVAEQAFYHDMDLLNLKVQAEGYIAFSSGLNNDQLGDHVVVLPLEGVSTSFAVSAFYRDDFVGEAYQACCEAFEWCHANL